MKILIMISKSTFGRWSTPKKARARVTKPLLANRAALSSGTDPLDRRMYWSCTRWKGNRNIATKVIHLLTPPKMVIIAGAGVFSGRNRVPTRPSSLTWDLSTLSPQLSFIQPQFFWRPQIDSSWRQRQRLVSPFCNCYWPGPTFAKSCFDTSRVMFLTYRQWFAKAFARGRRWQCEANILQMSFTVYHAQSFFSVILKQLTLCYHWWQIHIVEVWWCRSAKVLKHSPVPHSLTTKDHHCGINTSISPFFSLHPLPTHNQPNWRIDTLASLLLTSFSLFMSVVYNHLWTPT